MLFSLWNSNQKIAVTTIILLRHLSFLITRSHTTLSNFKVLLWTFKKTYAYSKQFQIETLLLENIHFILAILFSLPLLTLRGMQTWKHWHRR